MAVRALPGGSLRLRLVVLVVVWTLAAGCLEAPADDAAVAPAIEAARAYLSSAAAPDGGFGQAPGEPSSYSATAWALFALGASGGADGPVVDGGLAFLGHHVPRFGAGTAGVGSTPNNLSLGILAAAANGRDPRAVGGHDLVALLLDHRNGSGRFGAFWSEHLYAMHALSVAGEREAAGRARETLENAILEDGFEALGADRWYVAEAAVALAETGNAGLARDAAASLPRALERGGGLPPWPGAAADASTTAAAARAFVAVDDEVSAGRAVEFLMRQQSTNGAFRFRSDLAFMPVKTTAEAVLALAALAR